MKSCFKVCIGLLLLLILLSFCTFVSQTKASAFISSQIVDSTGEQGTQSSLALDSKGNPHISYTYSKGAETHLMYARWSGSEFNIQTVDTNGAANPSITLDSQNKPRICYTKANMTGSYLFYAELTSSGWRSEAIASAQIGIGFSDPSLKLDSKAVPHVAYVGPTDTLDYAVWTGSTWKIETISPGTVGVADPSLALDVDRKPWMSFFDPKIGLKCVSWTGSGWNNTIVDPDRNAGMESSLALDSFGFPHVSYEDDSKGDLKYARWNNSTWEVQIVDKNKHMCLHSSLALDSRGYPHISYEDNSNGNLMYASWADSIWALQIVDKIRPAPGDLAIEWGFPTSLALDASGTAHISYCGYSTRDLKYAFVSDLPSFLVTFNSVGIEDFSGRVLEVDSVELRLIDLPKSFVWREGSSHSFTFVPSVSLVSGEELMWMSTSGLSTSQNDTLTITKEGTVSASYALLSSNPTAFYYFLNYIIGSVIVVAVIVSLAFLAFRRKKSMR